ncbi:crotonobetaine/carnitine-CoA ligase [Micromonospora sp. Llam0]|uniref:AMP-binding protein n=1 Tax=Micromonospora sp. Llam0 TaxID=2485143 RepID=UPI000F9CCB4D|nr:AMP-binding protein [Micromonospora sp. Llam0]ROO60606.1 crotonobetaine/carnitine-CoA ligase [Micromonospora sp. Llam0]
MTRVADRPETLIDLLARCEPDRVVARFGDRDVPAGALTAESERIARLLASARLGLRPGDPVVTCLRPGPTLVHVLAGVARAGLVEVPLAEGTPPGAWRAAGARMAVLGTAALAADPGLARVAPVIRTVDDGGGPGDLDELPAGPLRRLPGPGDPAVVLSTSGTTGRPKGVILPHFAGVRHARRVSDSMAYGPDDVLYNAFPWNHVNIRHTGLFAALVSGARLLAVPRFSASAFWTLCREQQVTAFNFMGAVAAILLRAPVDPQDRDHRVTRAYGGPAPQWLAERFRDRFGVELIEAYACTELGDVASNRVGDVVPGTAGHPLPEYDLQLRDATGASVPSGATGRITVRARHPHISTLGYRGAPDPVPEWIATGDLGRLGPDGRLTFCGRHDDVVRRRGENLSAWDVEAVVAAMPGVGEAAAVGVDSEFTEQDLLVAVVPADPRVTAQDVHAWCRERLPRYAWPRYVAVLDELPRNASSKVSKPALRAPAVLSVATDLEHLRRNAGEELSCEFLT